MPAKMVKHVPLVKNQFEQCVAIDPYQTNLISSLLLRIIQPMLCKFQIKQLVVLNALIHLILF